MVISRPSFRAKKISQFGHISYILISRIENNMIGNGPIIIIDRYSAPRPQPNRLALGQRRLDPIIGLLLYSNNISYILTVIGKSSVKISNEIIKWKVVDPLLRDVHLWSYRLHFHWVKKNCHLFTVASYLKTMFTKNLKVQSETRSNKSI